MHVGGVLMPVANEFFKKFLNLCLPGIPCVSNKYGGFPLAGGYFVIQFKCGHKTCNRLYKVVQIGSSKFEVYNNNTDIVHVKQVVPQVRGIQRRILEKALLVMLSSEYREFSEKSIDGDLRKLGNLQECPSDSTLHVIRSKALRSQDFDAKLDAKLDVYIRRFYLEPYIVIAFSDAQFECLLLLADKFGFLKLFFRCNWINRKTQGKKIVLLRWCHLSKIGYEQR